MWENEERGDMEEDDETNGSSKSARAIGRVFGAL
jgi:hypothetical protein